MNKCIKLFCTLLLMSHSVLSKIKTLKLLTLDKLTSENVDNLMTTNETPVSKIKILKCINETRPLSCDGKLLKLIEPPGLRNGLISFPGTLN